MATIKHIPAGPVHSTSPLPPVINPAPFYAVCTKHGAQRFDTLEAAQTYYQSLPQEKLK